MAITAFSIVPLLLVFNLCFRGTYGDYGGWEGGHATFYVGGDSSNTTGMFKKQTCIAFAYDP